MRHPKIYLRHILFFSLIVSYNLSRADQVLSRVVNTKYGRVQGIVRHHNTPALRPVEVFLGVPYASPPVGQGRFTPTSSPLPWDNVKRCIKLPPVCPQPPLDEMMKDVPQDIEASLRSMKPMLETQSEDCLYLNIYAPHDGGGNYAVMVYIHGPSFMWGAGNLHDGGILASYGQVVVITVNYRLGPLGFLNTSPGGSRHPVVSNQGLMDQLAALSWVNENIAAFGGDKSRVTVFGHASGAACINYLIASPILVPGYFQRAILMSGSAFSSWAKVEDPLSVTARLAKLLNCSLPSDLTSKHPQTIACLRNASVYDLVNAPLPNYKFASSFGPSVDRIVVTDDMKSGLIKNLQKNKISLLFGVTEADGYPHMNAKQILNGLDIGERNRIFKTYVRNTFHHHLQEIYLAISKEYTDWGSPVQHPIQIRDKTVEALSDGGFLAPLSSFASIVSSKADTYMYLFAQHEKDRQKMGSVFGSEVPLIFGVPFTDFSSFPSTSIGPSGVFFSSSFGHNFTRADAITSEIMMKYWTNFAKSGTPNGPEEARPSLSYKERNKHRNITWDPYKNVQEKYIELNTRPRQRDHYRAHKIALWNWLLPELEQTGSKYPESEKEPWHVSEDPKHFIGPVRPLDPFRFLSPTSLPLTSLAPRISGLPNDEYFGPNVSAAQGSVTRFNSSTDNQLSDHVIDYTTALTLTVSIGLSLLVLNIILFAALLYKKERNSSVQKIKYDGVSSQPLCTVDSGIAGTSSSHDVLNSSGKDASGTCSSVDIQCTELHTFSTPPDIGDRNTEVTFHSSSSLHSLLNQPTSQFIPPPPLLATTPPTPPIVSVASDTQEVTTCTSAGCFNEVNTVYPEIINENLGHPYSRGSSYQGIHYTKGQTCTESNPCATSTDSCSFNSSNRCQPQYCSDQYSNQYPSSKESFSSATGQYPEGSCQYQQIVPGNGNNSNTTSQYTPEKFFRETYGSEAKAKLGSSSRVPHGRSSTLSRQVSTSSTCSAPRTPKPPPRTTTLPSYATLPRSDSKEKSSDKP